MQLLHFAMCLFAAFTGLQLQVPVHYVCCFAAAWGAVQPVNAPSTRLCFAVWQWWWWWEVTPLRDHRFGTLGTTETRSDSNLQVKRRFFDVKSMRSYMVLGLTQLCWRLQVSMVDGLLFDSLEAIARSIRGSKAPFGGIQLVLAGWSQTSSTHM